MSVLIEIALKSLLVAGLALGLLELMKRRAAAERSWVAHIGLFALVIMAFAPLALPSWNVEAPALFAQAKPIETPATSPADAKAVLQHLVPMKPVAAPVAERPTISAAAAASA